MKRIFAILLALLLALGMAAVACAEGTTPTQTGSITIQHPKESNTYKFIKVFDLQYNVVGGETKVSYTYTKQGETDAFFAAIQAASGLFTVTPTATNGKYIVSAKANTTQAHDIVTFLKNNIDLLPAPAAEHAGSTVEFTVSDLPLGYYYIVNGAENNALVALDSTTPNATVVDKTQTPTITKQVKNGADGAYGDTANMQVGDILYFKISGNLYRHQANGKNIGQFKFYDEMDPGLIMYYPVNTSSQIGLSDNLHVTIGGVEVPWRYEDVPTASETGYEILQAGNDYFAIEILSKGRAGNVGYWFEDGAPYEITYSVKVTEDAVIKDGSEDKQSNDNTVTLKVNTTTVIDTATVETYTYQFTLKKIDGITGDVLLGAEFNLYDAATEGGQIPLVLVSEGVYRVATPDERAVDGFVSAVIQAGEVVIKGLNKDLTYYLEETKAPEGYNALTERVEVNFGEADTPVKTIENNTGSELPSTGGIGTTIFYVVGGLLMAAAIIILVARKKVNSDK